MEDFIQVSARFRPLLTNDNDGAAELGNWKWFEKESCVGMDDPVSGVKRFQFDNLFPPEASNDLVFERVAKTVVNHVLDGYNGAILAYGQTGSGKTFTIGGGSTTEQKQTGILQRAVCDIFDGVWKNAKQFEKTYLIRVSYLEIYNEKIFDLLQQGKRSHGGLKIVREDPVLGVVIDGLQEIIVDSPEAVFDLLKLGEEQRHFRETGMNDRSSRSHVVFRIIIESKAKTSATSAKTVNVSCLSLVDLAGSERQTAAKTSGASLKEGCSINKSLLALQKVISGLTSAGRDGGYVSYRNSKLTRILRQSLGGNSITHLICTVSPSLRHKQESANTLQFGVMCKKVKNSAMKNEVGPEDALLQKYVKELKSLKEELEQQREKTRKAQLELEEKTLELDAASREHEDDDFEKVDHECKEEEVDSDLIASKYALRAQKWWRKAQLERLQSLREESKQSEKRASELEERLYFLQMQALNNTGEQKEDHLDSAGKIRRSSLTWIMKTKGAADHVLEFASALKEKREKRKNRTVHEKEKKNLESAQVDNDNLKSELERHRLLHVATCERLELLQKENAKLQDQVSQLSAMNHSYSLDAVGAWEMEMQGWYDKAQEFNEETEVRASLVEEQRRRFQKETKSLEEKREEIDRRTRVLEDREAKFETEIAKHVELRVSEYYSKLDAVEQEKKRIEHAKKRLNLEENVTLEFGDNHATVIGRLKSWENKLISASQDLEAWRAQLKTQEERVNEKIVELQKWQAQLEADSKRFSAFRDQLLAREEILNEKQNLISNHEAKLEVREKAILVFEKETKSMANTLMLKEDAVQTRERQATKVEEHISNTMARVKPTVMFARQLHQNLAEEKNLQPTELYAILSDIVDHFRWFNECCTDVDFLSRFLDEFDKDGAIRNAGEQSGTSLQGTRSVWPKRLNSLAQSFGDILNLVMPTLISNRRLNPSDFEFKKRLLNRYLSEAKVVLLASLAHSQSQGR